MEAAVSQLLLLLLQLLQLLQPSCPYLSVFVLAGWNGCDNRPAAQQQITYISLIPCPQSVTCTLDCESSGWSRPELRNVFRYDAALWCGAGSAAE